jgi:hypothetical protein
MVRFQRLRVVPSAESSGARRKRRARSPSAQSVDDDVAHSANRSSAVQSRGLQRTAANE